MLFWILNFGFWISAFTQTVTPTYIGTTGNYSTMGVSPFWSISSSVGEPMVETFTNVPANLILTQGFQQPNSCDTIIFMSAFPNDTICIGDSTTLGMSFSGSISQLTYNWSPSSSLSCSTCQNPIASPSVTTTYTLIVSKIGCPDDTGTITITVFNPVASISGQDTICDGFAASLTVSASGGVNPYTYLWNTGQTSTPLVVFPTVTTVYTNTVTTFGCTDVATHTVTVLPTPTITITGNDSICNGSSTSLIASGANSYIWSPTGAGLSCLFCSSPTASPSVTTTYTVTGTTLGCVGTQTFTVTVSSPPSVSSISASPDTICFGQSTALSAIGATMSPPLTYLWSTGGTGSSISDTPPSTGNITYTVTVSDATTCTASATVTVTVNAVPNFTFVSGTPNPVCSGQTLSLSAGSDIGTTYSWSGPNGFTSTAQNPTIGSVSTLASGTYSVATASAAGCVSGTATVSVTVNPSPIASVTPSVTAICAGDGIILQGSGGGSYSWSTGATTSAITEGPLFSNSTFSLVVTNGFGCKDTDTTTITVNQLPIPVISGNNTICVGQNSTLNASGGTYYSWSTGATVATIIVSPSTLTSYIVNVMDSIGCSVDDTITVTVNSVPTPTVSANDSTLCSGDNAMLTASGGTSYLWYNNSSTTSSISVSPSITTTYTVSVSNGFCSADDTIKITVFASPTASVTATPSSVCPGGSATLVASGGTVYSWSTTATTSSIIVTPTSSNTTYTVIVGTNNGCADTTSISVTINNPPPASITGNTAICSGNNVTLSASPNNNVTYLWNVLSQTTQTIIDSPTTTTTYSVIVTSTITGCSDTAFATVTVNPSPSVAISVTTNNPCAGTTDTLYATVSSGTSPFTYLWNTSATTDSIFVAPTANTTYTVDVTDANGCTAFSTFSIGVLTSPIASISGSTTICTGSNATLTASGGTTYSWSTGATTSVINPSPTTNISYTVTVANGACTDTETVFVSVTAPPVPGISASDTSVCSGTNDTLVATGGITGYLWSTGQTNATIIVQPVNTGTTPITVTYTVTAFNGVCSADTTITLIVKPLPVISVSASPQTICVGDSATLTPSGGIAYLWSTGATTFGSQGIVVSPTASASYSVAGVAPNGCANLATTSVNISTISVDAGSDQTICFGFTAQLNATVSGNAISYLWSPDSTLNNASVPNPTVNPESTSLYFVEVYNSDGCYAEDSVAVVIVRSVDCLVKCDKIYNGITPNGDGDNDEWWIDGIISFPENNVNIFNRWGTNVWGKNGYDNKNVVWNGTNQKGQELPDGTYYYIIEIHTGDGTKTCSGWIEITH